MYFNRRGFPVAKICQDMSVTIIRMIFLQCY